VPAYMVFIRDKTNDAQEMQIYGQKAGPASAGHPIKPLAIYGKHEVVEGPAIEGAVIVEFPDMEAAKAWYDSPGYTEAREHRFKGADYRAFIVEGI
jgi:uncharacterized protein (DUF1330 family)